MKLPLPGTTESASKYAFAAICVTFVLACLALRDFVSTFSSAYLSSAPRLLLLLCFFSTLGLFSTGNARMLHRCYITGDERQRLVLFLDILVILVESCILLWAAARGFVFREAIPFSLAWTLLVLSSVDALWLSYLRFPRQLTEVTSWLHLNYLWLALAGLTWVAHLAKPQLVTVGWVAWVMIGLMTARNLVDAAVGSYAPGNKIETANR